MKRKWILWSLFILLAIFIILVAYNIGVDKGKNGREIFLIIQNNSGKEGSTLNTSTEIKKSMPTRWDMLNLPYLREDFPDGTSFNEYETNILIECKNDTIIADKYLTYQFPFTCSSGRIKVLMPPQYLAQLSREGLTPIQLVAAYNFDEYGSEYEWKEFEI